MTTGDYVFVVGYPRSGTTLLSVLLDRHPRLCVTPETGFFEELAPSLRWRSDVLLMRALRRWPRLPELHLEPEQVRQHLGRHWATGDVLAAILDLYALEKGKPRCGEKTPHHLFHVSRILRVFPQAKVLCLLRDGRDAALSLRDMPWWRNKGLPAAAALWQRYLRKMETYTRRHPGRFHVVRYEELVDQPSVVMTQVMDLLGERFEPSQLQAGPPSGVVLPRSLEWKGEALKPIDPGAARRRRTNVPLEELAFLEQALGADLRRHGYR